MGESYSEHVYFLTPRVVLMGARAMVDAEARAMHAAEASSSGSSSSGSSTWLLWHASAVLCKSLVPIKDS